MRVTGGELCGRRLKVPPRGVRPTADRVRESLFMVLREMLPGARVLDLFAGSGALGIEALSRGAAHCVFVEQDRAVAAVAGANLRALGLETQSEVLIGSAAHWLARLAATGRRFDLVLVDPPYAASGVGPLLEDLVEKGVLARGGILAWEHDRRAGPLPGDLLATVDERRYGDTVVSLLRARGAPGQEL